MVYSDTSNKNGILQTIEQKCDLGDGYITGDTTNLKYFTNLVNLAGHKVVHLIHRYSKNWQYDDGNNTNLPSSTTAVVIGQRKYALPSEALTVQRVELKDSNGDWVKLTPITKEIIGEGLDDFLDDNGTPIYYRLVNNTIEIFPATDYAQADSLRVYYDRDSVDFATSDTTKTPGFASPYHEILPLKASIEWLKIKQPNSPSLALYLQDELKLEQSLKEFYGSRFGDYKPKVGRGTTLRSYR